MLELKIKDTHTANLWIFIKQFLIHLHICRPNSQIRTYPGALVRMLPNSAWYSNVYTHVCSTCLARILLRFLQCFGGSRHELSLSTLHKKYFIPIMNTCLDGWRIRATNLAICEIIFGTKERFLGFFHEWKQSDGAGLAVTFFWQFANSLPNTSRTQIHVCCYDATCQSCISKRMHENCKCWFWGGQDKLATLCSAVRE